MAGTTRSDGRTRLCRICGKSVFTLMDFGQHPFANALLNKPSEQVKTYPLKLGVCSACATAQLGYCANDIELYRNYLYITPESSALSAHYAQIIQYLQSLGYLLHSSRVLEIGSNIGRFLECIQPHVRTILGVDPAMNIAEMANKRGIPTINTFFDKSKAMAIMQQQGQKDLFVARHCFAHNEKPWRMLDGVRTLMHPESVLVIENAYFLDTIQNFEFDQIYHEHMYYHTLRSISEIVSRRGFKLIDALYCQIHGGTMLYIIKHKDASGTPTQRVRQYLAQEKDLHIESFYQAFVDRIVKNKRDLNSLIDKLRSQGKTIHVYGASAKATTLLNYYKITHNKVPLALDSTETKQGKYIPLVNIKIVSEAEGFDNPPDYYLLTIWNYKDEICRKVRQSGNKDTRFILPHPQVEIWKG